MRPVRPVILVQTNPEAINLGQPLTISGRLYDRDTNRPQIVSRIFLTIISLKDGHKVWDTEVVAKNDWKFDILVGTSDMKMGHKYQVRVTNNTNFSPMGATTFEIIKDATIPIILLPILIPIFKQREFLQQEINKFNQKLDLGDITPEQLQHNEHIKRQMEEQLRIIDDEKMRMPKDDITKKEVKYYIYRTEMDKRVCDSPPETSCKKHENKIFLPTEEIPFIPRHKNCRCRMEIVYKEETFEAVLEVYQAARVARTVKRAYRPIQAIKYL